MKVTTAHCVFNCHVTKWRHVSVKSRIHGLKQRIGQLSVDLQAMSSTFKANFR